MDPHGSIRPGPGFERRQAGTPAPEVECPSQRSRAAFVARLQRFGLVEGRVLGVALDVAPLQRALDAAGYEAAGMDHAPGATSLAEEHVDEEDTRARPWPVRLGDASERIPWPSATFDAVVLLDLLEHVADDLGVALEVKRVLRPGGVALIGCKHAGGVLARVLGSRWSFRRDPRHLRPYDVPAIVALFGYQGFRIKAWGTYFDLHRAGESTRALGVLRRTRLVLPGFGVGESAFVIAEKPLLDLPAWNQRRR